MKKTIQKKLQKSKRKIEKKLSRARKLQDKGRPVLDYGKTKYEMSDRAQAIPNCGIGAINNMVKSIGLAKSIDKELSLLKFHRPYHEPDHILNLAYNILCGGRTLQDIELLRNDINHLNVLGVESIPDPTTAGDFCRRFKSEDIETLMDIVNESRKAFWSKQDENFAKIANIDVDGVIVKTTGECKEGMDISYKVSGGIIHSLSH